MVCLAVEPCATFVREAFIELASGQRHDHLAEQIRLSLPVARLYEGHGLAVGVVLRRVICAQVAISVAQGLPCDVCD
jgi:hypothetical protein